MSTTISCPRCHHPFELSEAMRGEVEARLRAEMEQRTAAELREKDEALEAALRKADEAARKQLELARKERELTERDQKRELELERRLAAEREQIREAEKSAAAERMKRDLEERLRGQREELELARREADDARRKEIELSRREQALQQTVDARLAEERERVLGEAEAKARSSFEARLAAAAAEVSHAKTKEAELVRRQIELDNREQDRELAYAKKLAEEAARQRELTLKQLDERLALERESQRQRDSQHEESKRQLQRTIDELQQRLQQGSTQVQGEAQEVALAKLLGDAFRDDEIADVPKGVTGADLLQRVFTREKRPCGTIVWESKRTQHWSDGWIAKLKDDLREAGGTVAVLVSQALPRHVGGFGEVDGVWVCSAPYAVAVATLLRAWLAEVASVRVASADAGSKSQLLYEYVSGPEFRHRLEGIVQPYFELLKELEQEKRAFQSSWKRREKTIDRALRNVTALHGEVSGIAGASFEELEAFQLPGADAEGDDEPSELLLEPGPVASGPAAPEDVAALVAELERLGGREKAVGNIALQRALGWEDERFRAAKADLVTAGRLEPGKGRGGSVRLVA